MYEHKKETSGQVFDFIHRYIADRSQCSPDPYTPLWLQYRENWGVPMIWSSYPDLLFPLFCFPSWTPGFLSLPCFVPITERWKKHPIVKSERRCWLVVPFCLSASPPRLRGPCLPEPWQPSSQFCVGCQTDNSARISNPPTCKLYYAYQAPHTGGYLGSVHPLGPGLLVPRWQGLDRFWTISCPIGSPTNYWWSLWHAENLYRRTYAMHWRYPAGPVWRVRNLAYRTMLVEHLSRGPSAFQPLDTIKHLQIFTWLQRTQTICKFPIKPNILLIFYYLISNAYGLVLTVATQVNNTMVQSIFSSR